MIGVFGIIKILQENSEITPSKRPRPATFKTTVNSFAIIITNYVISISFYSTNTLKSSVKYTKNQQTIIIFLVERKSLLLHIKDNSFCCCY